MKPGSWLATAERKGLIVSPKRCHYCEGTGKVHKPYPGGWERCDDCDGSGKYTVKPIGKLRFVLSLVPSTNHLYLNSRRGRVKSPEYRAWIEAATYDIIRAKSGPFVASFAKPFCITITLVGGSGLNLGRDVANTEKATVDLLVSLGVIPGDSIRAGCWGVAMRYVHATEGDPHIVVEVETIKEPKGEST